MDDQTEAEGSGSGSVASSLTTSELELRLQRSEKANRSLEAYNRELRDQVELMNAKLHLAKKFLYQTVSTQTDIHIPSAEFNGRVFANCIMLPETISEGDDDHQRSGQEKLKSDLDSLLKDMKSSTLSVSDYTYDPTSKTYFSHSTGWYYYPQSSAFYNPKNRSYYRYDSESGKYEFMYALDESGNKVEANSGSVEKCSNKSTKSSNSSTTDHEVQTITSSDEEEGEIIDLSDEEPDVYGPKRPKLDNNNSKSSRSSTTEVTSTSNHIISSKPFLRKDQIRRSHDEHDDRDRDHYHDQHDHREHRDNNRDRHQMASDDHHYHRSSTRTKISSSNLNKIPPVRLIVQDAQQLDIGSLVLVSCMGGKIGTHSSCAVIVPDSGISQIHAEISYDHQRRMYTIQDLLSKNGTFQNGTKLKPMERTPLFHGDVLGFSDSVRMLAHIHQNRDITCDECEPGHVAPVQEQTGIYMNGSTSGNVKSGLKSLKKKYGLAGDAFRNKMPELAEGYRDRAQERQKEVGSDNPYEKTAAGSALDMPLDQKNKGFQMMEKMGWKSGDGLGNADDKAQRNNEPIDLNVRENRRGLGFGSVYTNDDDDCQ